MRRNAPQQIFLPIAHNSTRNYPLRRNLHIAAQSRNAPQRYPRAKVVRDLNPQNNVAAHCGIAPQLNIAPQLYAVRDLNTQINVAAHCGIAPQLNIAPQLYVARDPSTRNFSLRRNSDVAAQSRNAPQRIFSPIMKSSTRNYSLRRNIDIAAQSRNAPQRSPCARLNIDAQ